MYRIILLFAHERKFVPEIVPLWLKNRNQRIQTGGLMRGRGANTWSNRSVEDLSAGGGL